MVADQIEGGVPVKPTSGNTGSPVLNVSDGTKTSLLSDSTACALRTSASAIRTGVLLRCARSTTVPRETCAQSRAGEAASAPAIRRRASQLRGLGAIFTGRRVNSI